MVKVRQLSGLKKEFMITHSTQHQYLVARVMRRWCRDRLMKVLKAILKEKRKARRREALNRKCSHNSVVV